MSRTLRLACLISGGGRTMMNLASQIDASTLDASIELVIATREDIAGVPRARSLGLDVKITPLARNGSFDEAHDFITRCVDEANIDLICLCGYLRLIRLDPPLRDKVINIHPALLPSFGGRGMYGAHVHRAVLGAGMTYSGCTVHFVDEEYDHGPTILQRPCPVEPEDDADSLAARVFQQECLAYPEAIQLFAMNRIRLETGQVVILPET
ncbi:MAG: phosphoribosylglycinamide formyltransferase [Planctomycetota bacterium]|nr:phosphoribosylglycinamide formyltransferase [Planctomycetota bacterium]